MIYLWLIVSASTRAYAIPSDKTAKEPSAATKGEGPTGGYNDSCTEGPQEEQ